MILIADSGSTKTNWVLIDRDRQVFKLSTSGINPNYSGDTAIADILQHPELQGVSNLVRSLFFYGSGIGETTSSQRLLSLLQTAFPQAQVDGRNDLWAACRGLAGRMEGIVCILGTGSNACFYDGESISQHHYSLGYILGDEGSGFSLGKRLLAAYFYEQMPAELALFFKQSYQPDRGEVIERVYRQTLPNSYVASFAPFLDQHRDHPWIEQLLQEEFTGYYNAFLYRYQNSGKKVYATGSIAGAFADVFIRVCTQQGLSVEMVQANPLQGLIAYHQNQ